MQRLLPATWSSCPALLPAAALAAGIVAAEYTEAPVEFWALAALPALAAPLAIRRRTHRLVTLRPLVRTALVVLVLVSTGGARHTARHVLPGHHLLRQMPPDASPLDATLHGRLNEATLISERRVRFSLSVDSLRTTGPPRSVAGRVLVTVYLARPGQTLPVSAGRVPLPDLGDVVRIQGRLRPLPEPRNPADFDYGTYLARRGIDALLTLNDPERVRIVGQDISRVERLVRSIRRYVRRTLARRISHGEARSVLIALLIGDRSGLRPETRVEFSRTGLAHVLAISGLHVLIIGMTLYELLRPVLLRLRLSWTWTERLRAAFTLLVLVCYLLVSGGSPSVVRAVVMTGLWIGGTLLQRTSHPLNLLGVAACILLVLRPGALFDAGFQLSFAAVAALVVLIPVLRSLVPAAVLRWPPTARAVELSLASLAATLGTAPVTLYHFGQAAPAGLLLNLAAIPLTAVALPGAVLTVLTDGWAPGAASAFGASVEAAVRALLATAHRGADLLGWTLVDRYVRDGFLLAAFGTGLLALAAHANPRVRWRAVVGTGFLFVLALWRPLLDNSGGPVLDLWFLDVGHGDAVFIGLPNGRHLLVDAGARSEYVDHGKRTLLPHAARFGARRLDAVVLSHPHGDHIGGLLSLLHGMKVGRLLHNGQPPASKLARRIMQRSDSLRIPIRAVTTGDTLALDPSVVIEVLHPAEPPPPHLDPNEASIVLRIAYGRTTLLLMGDAEREAEHTITERFGEGLASDVIKVGHHGSRTSSTPRLVEHATSGADRTLAVVSVAARSGYGLPDEEVIDRWLAHGASVLSTADEGAVWLRSNGQTMWRVPWR